MYMCLLLSFTTHAILYTYVLYVALYLTRTYTHYTLNPTCHIQELDYVKRVEMYESYFEPLDSGRCHGVESKWSYLKCDHERQNFVVNKVRS